MAISKMKDFKNLTRDELATQIRDNEATLFKARMQKATGQLKDGASLWRIRKEIARMKTLMVQKSPSKA